MYFLLDTRAGLRLWSGCVRHGCQEWRSNEGVFGRCSLSPVEGRPNSTRPATIHRSALPPFGRPLFTHPWYLDPCLGSPLPGRASSVRTILHRLSRVSRTSSDAPRSQSVLEKTNCVRSMDLSEGARHRTTVRGAWVQGEARCPLGAAGCRTNRGVIVGIARLRSFPLSNAPAARGTPTDPS